MIDRFRCVIIIAALVLTWNASALADKESYCFVTAYSYNLRTAYHTLIFTQMSEGKPFNDEQYKADMKVIRKLEDAFLDYLKRNERINPNFFVFSARTGFKTRPIAEQHLNKELVDLETKGIRIKAINDFKPN